MISIQTLTEAFGHIPGISFDDETGLVRLRLASPAVSAEIFLQGAHLAKFVPAGGPELLFLSRESKFAPGKAIRGGIPLILPWFGPRQGDAAAPAHGLARTAEWTPEWIVPNADGGFSLLFDLSLDANSSPWWPQEFKVGYEIELGAELKLSLIIENSEESGLDFEAALHTYFAVGEIAEVKVEGLEGCEFLDQLTGQNKVQTGPIVFGGEFDAVYRSAGRSIVIRDGSTGRSIHIQTYSPSAVVWNPWIQKSARTADLGNDEWTSFVCVESGFVHEDKLHLEAGAHGGFQVKYAVRHDVE